MSIDTREADQSLEAAEKQLRQAIGVKDKLIAQLDNLDITDRAYDRKYNDLQERLENAYVKITELEDVVAQYQEEIESIRREKISADNVYNYLILFHDAYDQLPDIWKKKFFQSFIQEIQLYPEQQENGQVLKSMKFKFPVFYNGQTIEEIRWDKENTGDTVTLCGMLSMSASDFTGDEKIVFVENTFVDSLRAGQTKAFEFQRYEGFPEYDAIECSAQA